MKRSTSLALIIAMLVSMLCFPVGISAETAYDVPSGAIAINSENVGSLISQNGTDKTYYLEENITVSSYLATEFSGKLYGCGYTVTATSPLFNSLNGATVCDVKIASSITVGSKYVSGEELFLGSLANTATNAQISNISVSGTINVNSISRKGTVTNVSFGGLIGRMSSGTLTDCTNGCVIDYSEDVAGSIGGLVGSLSATEGSFSAVGCVNNAPIGNASEPVSGVYTGGIVALADAPAMTFTSCVNNGVINGNCANAGGIVGRSSNSSSTIQMTSCVNTANITTVTDNTFSTSAGIIGHSQSGVTFLNCSNSGNITTAARAAGIAGWVAGASTFTGCKNTGKLESTNATTYHGYVGGIAAYLSSGNVTFEYCENHGDLVSHQTAGGIVGYTATSAGTTIAYSINKGNVTVSGGYIGTANSAHSVAGGIVGRSTKSLTVKCCGSIGDVANNSSDTSYVLGMSATGLVGYAAYAPIIKDNFFIGKVSVKNSAYSSAISTVSSVSVSSVSNNYYLNATSCDYISSSGSVPSSLSFRVTDAQIKSGKLAYLLQTASGESEIVWGQDIGGSTKDAHPQLFGAEVFYDSVSGTYYNQRTLANSSVNLNASFTLYAYVYSDIDITDTYTAVFDMHGVKTTVKPTLYKADQDLYRFAFSKIAPQYIGENITITLYDGDKAVDTAEISLVKYCEALYSMNSNTLRQLAADIVAYGKAARNYVIENGLASADELAEVNSETLLTAASVNNAQKSIPTIALTSNIVSTSLPVISSASVQFNSTNRLSFKVSVPESCDPSDWKIVVDGKEYPLTSKTADGKYYSVLTDEIYAMDFMKDMAVVLTNGTQNHTLTYSIAIYGSRMSQNGSTAVMRDLAAATYWYGVSSHDYVTLPAVQYTLNGKDLSSFSIVADSVSDEAALSIADFVDENYGISLPIVTANAFSGGNAILIDQGNTYGGVRHGTSFRTEDDGSLRIYLDETSANIMSLTEDFLSKHLTAAEGSYDILATLPAGEFTYTWPSDVYHKGYTFNPAKDVTRSLAEGVTYIKRTYTTPSNVVMTAYILILETNAKAHFEVYNAPYNNVTCSKSFNCAHDSSSALYAECGNQHVTTKTASTLAAEMESAGKNVLAAANASFYMLSAGCNVPWGMQIVNGTVYREPRRVHNYNGSAFTDSYVTSRGINWFGVTKDGTPVMSDINGYNSTYKGNIQNGVGGSYMLIKNGTYQRLVGSAAGDARSTVGYNAKGDIVIIVTDGDNDNNALYPGATYADLSQAFMDLDMDITYAMNLDGGGSTAILVEDANGILQRENTVNDYQSGVSRLENRSIADIIAIVAD